MADDFRIMTPDPRFDPRKRVFINGYPFDPARNVSGKALDVEKLVELMEPRSSLPGETVPDETRADWHARVKPEYDT